MEPITLVSPDRFEEAFRCLLRGSTRHSAKRAVERLTTAGRLPPGCLRAMVDGTGRFLAAALMVPSPGRTVTITLSPPRGRNGAARCEAVLAATCEGLAEWPVDLAQALLAPRDEDMLQIYMRAGFTHLADLHTMTRSMRGVSRAEPMPAGVTLRGAVDEELPAILDETYIGTQDCPALQGLRRTPDIIVGHRAGGRVVPDLWQTILLDDVPVGCILMTCGDDMTADLAYVGLSPPARGKGIAHAVIAQMLLRLAAQGVRVLRLAVDATNTPAHTVYRRLGFKLVGTQRATIRSTRGTQGETLRREDVHMTSTPGNAHGG
jgi:mycothiol synthase